MHQRKANMKPAGLNDSVNIPLRSLLDFIDNCESTLKAKGELDEAFRFECLAEYLRKDYTPSKGLQFKPGVIGL